LASLQQFDQAASAQINQYKEAVLQAPPTNVSIEKTPISSNQQQSSIGSRDLTSQPQSNAYPNGPPPQYPNMSQYGSPPPENQGLPPNIGPINPVTIYPQQQNYGSLEDIIKRHDEANETRTLRLEQQIQELVSLITGRIQGDRQGRVVGVVSTGTGTGTGEDQNVLLSRSGNGIVNESINQKTPVDLSKLTSDSYAQTVRYLNLFKAIVKKQGEQGDSAAEESAIIIEKIDKAIASLQEIVGHGVTIDEQTQNNLNDASSADIASIMFSLLGFGVGGASMGGKRKCKRKTLKRMKKYKKGRPGRNTKKRHRKRPRS